MQFDFRIDREPSGDASLETWQARYARPGGWSCFRLAVRSDHSACAWNSRWLKSRLVGQAMSRKVDSISDAPEGYAIGPFRSAPQGSWTVLEVELPEKDASFLLGLAGPQGRGTVVLHRSDRAEAVLQILREVLGWDALALHLSGPSGADGPSDPSGSEDRKAKSCETGSAQAEPPGWLLELDEFFETIS